MVAQGMAQAHCEYRLTPAWRSRPGAGSRYLRERAGRVALKEFERLQPKARSELLRPEDEVTDAD